MNTLLILLACFVVGGSFAIIISSAVMSARIERNRRAHNLGRLLKCSHPEWN